MSDKRTRVVVFAGDMRGFSMLKAVFKEIRSRDGVDYAGMFAKTNTVSHPQMDISQFFLDANFDPATMDTGYFIKSMGIALPWKPDWLIIQRERWQPEQPIIHELKTRFGTKVGVVEINSHVINTIETYMEMLSRYDPPQDKVDVYFEHSDYIKECRLDALGPAYDAKIVVTGNPRGENVKDLVRKEDVIHCLDPYGLNLSSDRKIVLVCGTINTTRNEFFDYLDALVRNNQQDGRRVQLVYKPYPHEPSHPKFAKQLEHDDKIVYTSRATNQEVEIPIKVVKDDRRFYALIHIADAVICHPNSVAYMVYKMGKPIFIWEPTSAPAYVTMNDISTYTIETGNGVEDSATFWAWIRKQSVAEWTRKLEEKSDMISLFKMKAGIFMEQLMAVNYSASDMDLILGDTSKHPQIPWGVFEKQFNQYDDNESAKRIADFITVKERVESEVS